MWQTEKGKRIREMPSPLPGRLVREWSMAFVSSIWLDVIVKEDVNVCVCVWGFSEHILHPFPLSHLIDWHLFLFFFLTTELKSIIYTTLIMLN